MTLSSARIAELAPEKSTKEAKEAAFLLWTQADGLVSLYLGNRVGGLAEFRKMYHKHIQLLLDLLGLVDKRTYSRALKPLP